MAKKEETVTLVALVEGISYDGTLLDIGDVFETDAKNAVVLQAKKAASLPDADAEDDVKDDVNTESTAAPKATDADADAEVDAKDDVSAESTTAAKTTTAKAAKTTAAKK